MWLLSSLLELFSFSSPPICPNKTEWSDTPERGFSESGCGFPACMWPLSPGVFVPASPLQTRYLVGNVAQEWKCLVPQRGLTFLECSPLCSTSRRDWVLLAGAALRDLH